MIFGIDAGNVNVKIVNKNGAFRFVSDIGEWRDRRLSESFGADDMEFEYNGRKGFAGTLARYESEFGGTLKGDTKANEDVKLRVLLALHRYSDDVDNAIVVGQPIKKHVDAEKEKIKKMLLGEHELTVNGVTKKIKINRVEVAAECASVGMIDPPVGEFHLVDLGGGTLNWATCIYDGERVRKVDVKSDTEVFGIASARQADMHAMARILIANTQSKWKQENVVRSIGGVAGPFAELLREYYPQAAAFFPTINGNQVDPTFASAVAFYEIAKKVYG
jgi:plasmid segregation protein ParM